MSAASPPRATNLLADLGPGVLAASMFATSNVLSKLVLNAGSDVLTLSVVRGLIGVALLFIWLRIGTTPKPHTPRQRAISLGLGLVFACIVFGLFAAFAAVGVPIGILGYFVYPLITGFIGMLLGIERIGWRGALAALTAFCGLALMIRANPHEIALAGIAFSFMAACGRTIILLVTRATLQDADPQLTTWYTILSSTVVLGLVALATWNWQSPATAGGWAALIAVGFGTTIGVLSLYVSIKRIGPFRSALIMYLEPLLSTVFSAPVLGEIITPWQAVGGAMMLISLVSFQLRK